MRTSSNRIRLSLAFFTILVDMMGFGAAFPVLPALFSPESTPFSNIRPDRLSIWYGALMAVFALAQFIGAPVLGALSDRYGRRPLLLVSLLGSALGYAVFAYGIQQNSLLWLFVGRIVPGFAGGNVAVIYSSLADVSQGQQKVKDFGLAGAAFGLGMILGPVLGGLLGDASLHPSFGLHVPFWGMVLLSSLNAALVFWAYPETNAHRNKEEIKSPSWFKSFALVSEAFRHKELKWVFLSILLHGCGFALFIQFVAFFLQDVHSLGQMDIGLLFGYVGLLTVVTQGLLVRPLSRFFAPERLVANVIPGFAIGIFVLTLPAKVTWLYFLLPLPTIFQGLYMPNMTAVVSNLSPANAQGRMLSINQSLTALSNAIPPLFGGWLYLMGPRSPVYVSVLLSLMGWGVFNLFFQRYRKKHKQSHLVEKRSAAGKSAPVTEDSIPGEESSNPASTRERTG